MALVADLGARLVYPVLALPWATLASLGFLAHSQAVRRTLGPLSAVFSEGCWLLGSPIGALALWQEELGPERVVI